MNAETNSEQEFTIEHREDDSLLAAQQKEVAEQVEAPEYTEAEQKAMEFGWDPNFEGDNKKTAEQYLAEGEKIGLKKQVREKDTYIKDLEALVRTIESRQANLEREMYQKALQEIEGKRRQAVEMADGDAYDKADKEYQALKAKEQEIAKPPTQHDIESLAEVKAFQERNKDWFHDNTPEGMAMSKDAIEMEILLRDKHPDRSNSEILHDVEQYIKVRHKDFFRSNLRTKTAPLATTGQRAGSGRTPTIHDLTPSQKKVINMYKDQESFNVEEYIKELHRDGLVPGFK